MCLCVLSVYVVDKFLVPSVQFFACFHALSLLCFKLFQALNVVKIYQAYLIDPNGIHDVQKMIKVFPF